MLLRNSAHTYHAKWVKTESTEQPTTSVLIARNSSILSLKAMISVGQTNVLKNKYQQHFTWVEWISKGVEHLEVLNKQMQQVSKSVSPQEQTCWKKLLGY